MHVIGKIGYAAGDAGTVTLVAGERLIALWCVATAAGAYVTIDGGSQIPLIAGIPFGFALESRTEEWAGVVIVFHGTVSYFVKSKKRTGS
jgi:hypothetical protein